MIGVPSIAGSVSTSVSASSYQVPVAEPVPPGTQVTVYAGASGSTTATSVADSQGNSYALAAASTTDQWLQAFTATAADGLNPLAGDEWTVTFSAANTQTKNIIVVQSPGCGVPDVSVAASGNSAAPSVSGSSVYGNELLLACVQAANAGGDATFAGLSPLGAETGSGQGTFVAYGIVSRSGPLTASASLVSSATWAAIVITLPALTPVAAGDQQSPSGGAQLPPYPVLPSPRTWSPGDMLLTPWLRADPQNALTLLANPPLVIAGQTMTTQSIPNATVTTLALDTELTDAWQSHSIPARQVYPPLEGWYLAEGQTFLNDTTSGTTCTAGIQVQQAGVDSSSDGGKTGNNGTNFPVPTVCDLVQVNPAADDSIALYCWQNSGAAAPIASAWLKTEWVAASSGTVVPNPVPAGPWTTGATVLLQPVAVGATTVIVEDPTGIVVGGIIALDSGNPADEQVEVTSAAGQTIGITSCFWPHPATAPVAVPVSAAWMNQQVRDKINFLAYPPIARLTSQGTSQTLPSQAWPAGSPITFSNPATSGYRNVDNYGGWTSGQPNQYTFPVGGTWYLAAQVYLLDASSPVNVTAGLQVSGGTIEWGDRTLSTGNSSYGVCATVRDVVRVGPGQYVQVIGSQGSGGPLSVLATTASHARLVCRWRGF